MNTAVTDNPERSRFELTLDGALVGWAEYRPAGDAVVLAHTEIEEGHEGAGLGGVLVRGTIDGIRAKGEAVKVTCPFAAGYIERHPELAELVVPPARGEEGDGGTTRG